MSDETDGDPKLSDFVKCDAENLDDSIENCPIGMQNGRLRPRNDKRKSESENPQKNGKIKGFVVDSDNRYHCLDCGKTFKQKTTYNQHQRL